MDEQSSAASTTESVDPKAFRALVDRLRHRMPCPYTVKVTRCKTPTDVYGDCGYMEKKEPYIRIRVSRDLDPIATMDTLAHEWAHAYTWTVGERVGSDHTPIWGVAYAQAYRILIGEE